MGAGTGDLNKAHGLSMCGHQNLNLCEYQVSWIWFNLGFFLCLLTVGLCFFTINSKPLKYTLLANLHKKTYCDLPLTMLQSLVFKIKKPLEEGEIVRARYLAVGRKCQ